MPARWLVRTFLTGIKTLGLPADTDPTNVDLILSTVADLAAQVAELDPAKPSTVAAAAQRAGLEVIDPDTAEALRRDAARGRQMAAAAAQQTIEAFVEDAVPKGKIAASRHKHWITLLGADPGMADVLASIPNETAIPLAKVGHSVIPNGDALDGPGGMVPLTTARCRAVVSLPPDRHRQGSR
jgi:hypothetical protein